MKRYSALVAFTLLFLTTVSGSGDISEVNQIFNGDDTVIYSHGPNACDTNCRIGREIADKTGLEGNLDYRPPTPEVGETSNNLVLIGDQTLEYIERSQDYSTEDLDLENLEDSKAKLSLRETSSNDQHVLVIRGDSQKSLYSGGQFFIDLMNGQNLGEVTGESSYSLEGSRYERDYTLGDVKEVIISPLIVYGADTRNTRQTAQELALVMDGQAINDRDLEERDKENRDLVLINPPPTNSITEELAQKGKAWSSEDWSDTDGFRLNFVKNAFSFDNHALVVSGDVNSRTDLAVKYMEEFYEGEHQEISGETSVTRSQLPRTLEIDTTYSIQPEVGDSIPLTVEVVETGEELTEYELEILRDGQKVTDTDSLSIDRDEGTSLLEPEKYGSYNVKVSKEATSEETYEIGEIDIGVTRSVRTENLEFDTDSLTVMDGETVEITPSVNGEPVEAELYVNEESMGEKNLFEIRNMELGDHQLELRKSDERTETEIVEYNSAETVLTVEERSLLGQVAHVITSLISL